jgi:hypothetical protein
MGCFRGKPKVGAPQAMRGESASVGEGTAPREPGAQVRYT